MAINNATIDDTTPGTTETTLFTSSGSNAVTVLYLCNTDTITRTVDIHVKPLAEAKALENQIYSGISIPSGDTYVIDAEKLILDDTDIITAVVGEADTTTAVVATISSIGI
jgi:hypothetical protein